MFDAVAARWAAARRTVVAPRRGDARRAGARPRRGVLDRDRRDGRAGRRCSIPTPSRRPSPTRSRCWRPGPPSQAADARARPAASPRSRWSGRPGTTPSATARWASASTTTSPSRPRTRWRAASTASRSSTSTCTTATARSGCSTTIRACCTSRPTSSRSIRAPAPPTKSGRGGGRRVHGQRAARGGRDRRRLRSSCTATIVVPVLDRFAPELVLVSAGFDAHERDPLASMRMTTDGLRRHRAAI